MPIFAATALVCAVLGSGTAAQAAPSPANDVAAVSTTTSPSESSDVYVVSTAGGTVSNEVHSMATPEAASALRAQLTAQGKRVLPPGQTFATAGSTTVSALAAACPSYGTATAWCGHAWAYNGYNDPQVYFLDHTPAGYPVSNATADWYRSPGIDAYYRSYTQGCPNTRVHCVHVYTYHPANSGEYGSTYWDPSKPNAVTVQISDRLRYTTQGRKSTCHELGHALGLGHNSSSNSCMFTGRAFRSGDSYQPSSQDFVVLTRIYPYVGT